MIDVIPTDMIGDVRSHPIESVKFEAIERRDILKINSDSMELCFPLKDSFQLPGFIYDEFVNWVAVHAGRKEGITYLTGTADGTGISESSEMGWDRALSIKRELISHGWSDENIQISTEQRNSLKGIQNRCVMINFE